MLFKLVTIIFDVILNILANIVHFNTPSPKDCQLDRCVPLVVHGDGADSHRRRSFLVLTMGSLVVSGNFGIANFYCTAWTSPVLPLIQFQPWTFGAPGQ